MINIKSIDEGIERIGLYNYLMLLLKKSFSDFHKQNQQKHQIDFDTQPTFSRPDLLIDVWNKY